LTFQSGEQKMDSAVSDDSRRGFRYPEKAQNRVDSALALRLIVETADLTLLLDERGVIRDLGYSTAAMAEDGVDSWIDRPWIDTVTVESRPKIDSLLNVTAEQRGGRWRQVNHARQNAGDVPITYMSVPATSDGWVLAVGRDLRDAAALQQRLVEAQQAMERDYARLRAAESRYHLLFQSAGEAVLIVDAATGKVSDANRAAGEFLDETVERLKGRAFIQLLAETPDEGLSTFFTQVRGQGVSEPLLVRLAGNGRSCRLHASHFRMDRGSSYLIRLTDENDLTNEEQWRRDTFGQLVEAMPDAFVVTDTCGS